jgi:hypothetical protein
MAKIFDDGIKAGLFVEHPPMTLADIFWALFSGVVLWEASKKIIDEKKNFLKETLSVAFEIFYRGLKKP